MTVNKLRDRLDDLIRDGNGNARVYCFTDTDPMDAELVCIEAREVVPFNPFWSTVEGFMIQ